MVNVTVADALALEVVRHAGPEVLAGADALDRPVRWVHSAEIADIAPLLREGDLVLSTGIALPGSEDGLRDFAASVNASAAAGIVLELGRRWTTVPAALVETCEAVGLPLIALHHEVRFAAITQALGERIVDQRIGELREAHEVHATFTDLSIGEAGPQQILEAVQRLAGATVVLESADHQVIDYRTGPGGGHSFLTDWPRRSRSVAPDSHTTWDGRLGWLVTRLGRREREWGRLIVQCPHEPSQRLIAVAERGAAALAMHRLHDRHRNSQMRRSHHELILGLIRDPTDAQVLRRCELTEFPVSRHQYVAIAVRPVSDGSQPVAQAVDEVVGAVVHASQTSRIPALVCEIDQTVRILLALRPDADATQAVDSLAEVIHRRRRSLVCAGRPVSAMGEADRTLRESVHVLGSVKQHDSRQVHRLEDVHLRGLLALWGDDDRLHLFVERELGRLRQHDAERGTDHLGVLEALLTHPGSKSEAAASLQLSRPVFYDRVGKIERLLGVDLDDPDIRVSLHVALVASQLVEARPG